MEKAKIHNGIYTVKNRETGEYRTFKIRTISEDSRFAPGERTIAILTSPDNNRGYTQFGFVTDAGIAIWRKKQGGKNQAWTKWQWFAFMVWDVLTNDGAVMKEKGKEYDVELSKRCLRCNRRLTTPESLKHGIGPECLKQLSPG